MRADLNYYFMTSVLLVINMPDRIEKFDPMTLIN